MKTEEQISVLLQKYQDGELTLVEQQELSEILNHPEYSPLVDKVMREQWQNSDLKNIYFDSEKMYRTISDNIAQTKTRQLKPYILSVLKYAAIIILSVGISWLIFSKTTPNAQKQAVRYNEITVPYGSKSSIVLSDSTKIWLNSGSKLKYPDKFTGKERIVYLEGEAYFDVAHDKNHQFIVKTAKVNIKVFGTKFNVKSFPEEKEVVTTLVSGSVMLEKLDESGEATSNFEIIPNQIVSFSKATGQFTLKYQAAGNENPKNKNRDILLQALKSKQIETVELTTSWKEDKLFFRGDSIESLIQKLQRWYDVKIMLKAEELRKYTYSGTFDKETIEQALEALQLTTPFNFTMDKNIITIYSKTEK